MGINSHHILLSELPYGGSQVCLFHIVYVKYAVSTLLDFRLQVWVKGRLKHFPVSRHTHLVHLLFKTGFVLPILSHIGKIQNLLPLFTVKQDRSFPGNGQLQQKTVLGQIHPAPVEKKAR